jgi:hypothetical protein
MTCQAEAPALTDEQVIADADGSLERAQTTANIIAGRSCRDALHRVCQWHKERGDAVDCDTPLAVVR